MFYFFIYFPFSFLASRLSSILCFELFIEVIYKTFVSAFVFCSLETWFVVYVLIQEANKGRSCFYSRTLINYVVCIALGGRIIVNNELGRMSVVRYYPGI
jgi:hypothetical protein